MTIKELEEKTGMSRTNIRFYEAEGLIHPPRRENGYRDYSQNDLEILLKVKLLRSMEIPLDQVKAAVSGERQLGDILNELSKDLARLQSHQERICQALTQMLQDGTQFENLQTENYLSILESGKPVEDAPPRLNLPWRRYWARCFDYSLYNILVSLVIYDFQHRTVFLPILTLIAMLTIEPLLLSLFGTTPGKGIFGIRVTDRMGGRLDYNTAIERTWTVLWEGEALRFPLICLYFQYKGLDLAEQEIPLSWESDSELTYKDDKIWRYGLYILAVLAEAALVMGAACILGG